MEGDVTDVRLSSTEPAQVPGDVVVVGMTREGDVGDRGRACLAAAGIPLAVVHEHSLGSRPGDSVLLPAHEDAPWGLVLCVRTFGREPASDLWLLAETAGVQCHDQREVILVGAEQADGVEAAVRLAVDGFTQGRYRFSRYRSGDRVTDKQMLTVCDSRFGGGAGEDVARERQMVGRWVSWVRDLVNTPARDLTPQALATEMSARADEAGVSVRVLRDAQVSDGSWDALDAVGAGSNAAPVLLELRHEGPTGNGPLLGLAGKGVTFDSGGLDLKTLQQMHTMKQDMAGAAVVAGATFAAAELDVDVQIVTVVALVENMTGGAALRPGDVVRHRDGTTTEVISPDAEGRLILADALLHLAGQRPDAMLDVATLTGGGGLGPDLWAIVGNDRALTEAVLGAGDRAGDRGWELPLVPAYRRFLEPSVADRRNMPVATRYSFETLAAAAYLADFASSTPWAHLDISAVAGSVDQRTPQGATGRPMRAVIEWLTASAVWDGAVNR